MNDKLETIVAYKKDEIIAAKRAHPLSVIEHDIKTLDAPRGFANALAKQAQYKGLALIAEIKKASPSKGLIRSDFNPKALARAYQAGGATCLSVLTDQPSFQGHPENLRLARGATTLPLLRKDFMLDTYQVAEARALGADAILIIMAMVDDICASDLLAAAKTYQLDALIEVHDRHEFDRALKLDNPMIGINNRNLKTFEVDLATTESLSRFMPDTGLLVAESGITTPDDAERMQQTGAKAILVGETLMRAPDVTLATRKLLQKYH